MCTCDQNQNICTRTGWRRPCPSRNQAWSLPGFTIDCPDHSLSSYFFLSPPQIFGHSLGAQKAVSFFNLLDNFNVGATWSATYLVSFLAILTLIFFINELSHRIRFESRRAVKPTTSIASIARSFRAKKLSAIGLFVLFVHLFLWLTRLFITNNIKTNKVVRPIFRPVV